MKFEFVEYHKRATDNELIEDIKRVASHLQCEYLSQKAYNEHGTFSSDAVADRFGSWNNGLSKAGLSLSFNRQHTKEELFANLEKVWRTKGKQPVRKDMDNKSISTISSGSYRRHFRTWNNALREFVSYINSDIDNLELSAVDIATNHKTPRDPNLRLRFRVMQRDNFKCCLCGASPATDSSVVLHIDHIQPWAKGGETVMDNLCTLCSQCNLGKGDLTMG